MDQRGRVRLSTMEIVLLGFLVGSLLLGLLQAWQLEHAQDDERRLRRATEPDDER